MKMFKIVAAIAVILMLVMSLAACQHSSQGTVPSDNSSQTTAEQSSQQTTAHNNEDVKGETHATSDENVMVYCFAKYGYDISYPSVFKLLNEEGNMVEFRTDSGADFTILVLDNRYETVEDMIDGEKEDGMEVVSEGEDSFMLKDASNGRTTYTLYYCGDKMITCELTYPDALGAEMSGLQDYIKVLKD